MASTVDLDASPATVLRAMRGSIVAAQIAYPDVIHVEIRDSHGDLWRLATQDAQWSPSDPGQLVGRSVEDVAIEETSGRLRCRLSDGTTLDVEPVAEDSKEDPPAWELISPTGLLLEFGPGLRWQISSADVPVSSSR